MTGKIGTSVYDWANQDLWWIQKLIVRGGLALNPRQQDKQKQSHATRRNPGGTAKLPRIS